MKKKKSGLEYIDLVLAAADCTADLTDYFDGLRVVLLVPPEGVHLHPLSIIQYLLYAHLYYSL